MGNIITLQQLSDYTGESLTGNKRAEAIVAGVNAWVSNYTGRIFGGVETVTEEHDYEPVIFLNKLDITELLSVKVGTELRDLSTVKLSKKTGRLVLSGSRRWHAPSTSHYDNVTVVYKAGVTDVPPELVNATLVMASAGFNDKTSAGIMSESVGGYSVSYGNAMASMSGSEASDPMDVFNYYRVRRM